jgi:hypothetical protein
LSIHDARRQNSAGAVTRTRISTTTIVNITTTVRSSAHRVATSGFSRARAQFLKPVLAADEEVKQFPDSTVAAGRLGQRQVRLDLVTVAAAVVVLDDVARPR